MFFFIQSYLRGISTTELYPPAMDAFGVTYRKPVLLNLRDIIMLGVGKRQNQEASMRPLPSNCLSTLFRSWRTFEISWNDNKSEVKTSVRGEDSIQDINRHMTERHLEWGCIK